MLTAERMQQLREADWREWFATEADGIRAALHEQIRKAGSWQRPLRRRASGRERLLRAVSAHAMRRDRVIAEVDEAVQAAFAHAWVALAESGFTYESRAGLIGVAARRVNRGFEPDQQELDDSVRLLIIRAYNRGNSRQWDRIDADAAAEGAALAQREGRRLDRKTVDWWVDRIASALCSDSPVKGPDVPTGKLPAIPRKVRFVGQGRAAMGGGAVYGPAVSRPVRLYGAASSAWGSAVLSVPSAEWCAVRADYHRRQRELSQVSYVFVGDGDGV